MQTSSQSPILVISGPTASGKSTLALQLAVDLEGEIINADSVQFYKDFNIGAAKPSPEDFKKVPHHLFSIFNPGEDTVVSAGLFSELAESKIKEIIKRNKLPIIVGGSGLYLRALLLGLDSLDVNQKGKDRLIALEKHFLEKIKADEKEFFILMHKELERLDSEIAKQISVSDIFRVRNALKKIYSNEKILSQSFKEHNKGSPKYLSLLLYLDHKREQLYQRINKRVEEMFKLGLIEEVSSLLKKYDKESHPFKSIGYKEVIELIENKSSLNLTKELIKKNSRNYAKRQLTWWRNQPKILGFEEKNQIVHENFSSKLIGKELKNLAIENRIYFQKITFS